MSDVKDLIYENMMPEPLTDGWRESYACQIDLNHIPDEPFVHVSGYLEASVCRICGGTIHRVADFSWQLCIDFAFEDGHLVVTVLKENGNFEEARGE